eukprot:gene6009-5885_t
MDGQTGLPAGMPHDVAMRVQQAEHLNQLLDFMHQFYGHMDVCFYKCADLDHLRNASRDQMKQHKGIESAKREKQCFAICAKKFHDTQ